MGKNILRITVVLFVILSKSALAPNMWTGYSFPEIQARLADSYRIDQEIMYQKNLHDFKLAMAAQESSNNWKNYNPYGYIGKFQFGRAALKSTGFGHVNFVEFMNNPLVFPEQDQEKAMDSLLHINEFVLGNYLSDFEGRIFLDSIKITKIGMLAASHLAGPGYMCPGNWMGARD